MQNKPKPILVDSTTQAVSDLSENKNLYEPSTKPPTNYKAPSVAFHVPEIHDSLEAESVKNFIEDEAITSEEDYVYINNERALSTTESSGHEMILDDMIIKSIEEALAIRVPNDPMIRHRDTNPKPTKISNTINEVSNNFFYIEDVVF